MGDLTHMWGTAASPVLYGDLVIQVCDSKKNSYIAAFDTASGDRVWRTERASYGCWSTPVVVEAEADGASRTELVVNGTASRSDQQRLITAYDPDDGRQLWQVSGTTEWVTPTPVVSGGLVYCACGRNGPIFAIRPGGTGDVTESHVVWKARRGGPYIPSGLAYRNRLFLVRDNRDVACYNAGDGQQIWTGRLGGTFSSSLVAAAGRIYATNERGTVYVFAAADSFELLAKNNLGERCLATPAIAGGELFIRTEGHLYCIAEEKP
ncbi:MAG: PQQ-binding-like beta-propeller repeat protein [Planctomycetes bacterium]|nr:PQQ-binding-like beta-propeller repeat protein [Planctomycetota bacterium]